jgi:hypothetical protein
VLGSVDRLKVLIDTGLNELIEILDFLVLQNHPIFACDVAGIWACFLVHQEVKLFLGQLPA